jgi:hypothetical protein
LEGGWAVLLIYDYLSGSAFAKIKLRWRSKMSSVTAPKSETNKNRLAKIQPNFVDFKRYSRFLNPENTSYDFRLETLFN